MIRLLLSGCNGKMGQVITKFAENYENIQIVAGVDLNNKIGNSYPVYNNIFNVKEKIDVIIDFSSPANFNNILEYIKSNPTPVVIATTGLSTNQTQELTDISVNLPVFFSSNMSLGVNLLLELVKKATRVLQNDFDIEIIEKHHNQKIDAPSGTALTIADSISSVLDSNYDYVYDRHQKRKKRSKKEIGIHAVRGGTIVGEHSVIFAGNDEIIEINHIATSKEIFATGALNAAIFIHGKSPGLYKMEHLVSENK